MIDEDHNQPDDPQGTEPLPEPSTLDDEDARDEMQDTALLERLQADRQKPPSTMEPSDSGGRPEPARLPDESGMGKVLARAGYRIDPLPALRQSLPLRRVLESLGPDLVAGQCAAINRFNRIADRAEDEDNKVLELLATKASAQYQHKLIELLVGRTVNLNTAIKSQRDLPKLDKLSPEKRAQLEQLVSEMSDVVDGEIVNDSD